MALAAITVVLLLSQVGWLVVPLLLPAHMWAARRSGRAGRLIWSLLPASGLACAAWALTYLAVGEAKPVIWLVPLVVLVIGVRLIARVATPKSSVRTA